MLTNTNDYSIIIRNKISWERFLARIAVLESAKRDDIPESTIKTWFKICQEMNWSEDDLDAKFGTILKTRSFGNETVRIDHFFIDEKTFTYSEVKLLIDREIERRIKRGEVMLQFNTLKQPREFFCEFFDIKDIDVRLAIQDAMENEYNSEKRLFFEELLEGEKNRLRELIKTRRTKLAKLSLDKKKKLIKLLAERKIVSVTTECEEKLFIENIQIFAPEVSEEDIKSLNKKE